MHVCVTVGNIDLFWHSETEESCSCSGCRISACSPQEIQPLCCHSRQRQRCQTTGCMNSLSLTTCNSRESVPALLLPSPCLISEHKALGTGDFHEILGFGVYFYDGFLVLLQSQESGWEHECCIQCITGL